MLIRFARAQERPTLEDMWRTCFEEETPQQIHAWFDLYFTPQRALVAECGGCIAASLQLVPYRAVLRGVPVDIWAVTGVCTLPQYRGQGCAAALLAQALRQLRKQGVPLAFLFTAIPAFYRRLGWEHAADACLYRTAGGEATAAYRVECTAQPDAAQIQKIYTAWGRGLNLACLRGVDDMTLRIAAGTPYGAAWYTAYNAAGSACAYAAVEGNVITEQAWTDKAAMQAVLAGLPGKALLLPRSMHLPGLMPGECLPRNMLRLTDAAALLQKLPAAQDGCIHLLCRDALWGEQCLCITAQGGRIAVTPGDAAQAADIDAAGLMQVITGYRAASAVVPGAAGRTLQAMLPPQINFMFEIC